MSLEVSADLRKFISDATADAIKDSPLVMSSEKFVEVMIAMYVRGVADGRRAVVSVPGD